LIGGSSPIDLFSELSEVIRKFQLSEDVKKIINEAVDNLNGSIKRKVMAKTVDHLGKGGQRLAERELKWSRTTIRKGMHEIKSGFSCVDNFSGRGRKLVEEHHPNLISDIKNIVEPSCQADPTFRTTRIYTPLTAKTVRKVLLEDKGYLNEYLPSIRTISTKLNQLNFHPQKVAKTKPLKRIKETDAIFKQVFKINKESDETNGVLRISIDAKAQVKIGKFSRGGKSRQGEKALDHDFGAVEILTPLGFFLPFYNESYFYFTKGKVTADFIVDLLEMLWPSLKQRFNPNTLVLNLDNGPENNSHRTQFIKRIVDFASMYCVNIKLAYYPPYHSKYNPIERVWGVLENHWNGEILYSIEKTLGLARTMTYNGINPVVELVEKSYPTGIKLDKKTMAEYEKKIIRLNGLEHWFVDVPSACG